VSAASCERRSRSPNNAVSNGVFPQRACASHAGAWGVPHKPQGSQDAGLHKGNPSRSTGIGVPFFAILPPRPPPWRPFLASMPLGRRPAYRLLSPIPLYFPSCSPADACVYLFISRAAGRPVRPVASQANCTKYRPPLASFFLPPGESVQAKQTHPLWSKIAR
jgi:hypothetical protein